VEKKVNDQERNDSPGVRNNDAQNEISTHPRTTTFYDAFKSFK